MQCMAVTKSGTYSKCGRDAVAAVNGVPYCKQHAKRKLPKVQVLNGGQSTWRELMRFMDAASA